MKLAIALALVSLTACAAQSTSEPQAAAKENRIAVYLGQRTLDRGDWDPVEEQPTAGIEYVRETAGMPVGLEVGLMGSSDDDEIAGTDVTGSTVEFYAGIRKTFGYGLVRPYLGIGLAHIDAKVDVDGVGDEDDSSFAGYAHGGIDFDVTQSFFVGLDVRALFFSAIEIGSENGDADYVQLALRLGFAF
jgi:opacity protein-like surface antigen